MDSEVDDLIAEINDFLAKLSEESRWKRDNPYVIDLIRVLYTHDKGLDRKQVMRDLRKIRVSKGLEIPEAFEETVQSAFQAYAGAYSSFSNRGAPETDNLFYAPQGKGRGVWAVRRERAEAWLIARKSEVY